MSNPSPARVRVLLDCATHAARLDDERIVLSEFIVDMADALAVLARQSSLELVVTGEAGGGVYVALAGPAPVVAGLAGAAVIGVLPQAAIAAILISVLLALSAGEDERVRFEHPNTNRIVGRDLAIETIVDRLAAVRCRPVEALFLELAVNNDRDPPSADP